MVLAAAALAVACSTSGTEGSNVRPPSADDVPPMASIAAATLTSGVQIGPARRPESVAAFRIAKRPVTVAQYLDCVSAGACAPAPDNACSDPTAPPPFNRPTVAIDGGGALPATCVGAAQAKAFCAWVGGKLPSLSQFLLAARGPSVRRFAWGDTLPTCDQRPDGTASQLGGAGKPCASGDPLRDFAVGQHAAGASPFGVEDVLSSPGELLAVSADAFTTACAEGFGACVAYGLRPGAIDGFEPLPLVDGAVAHHAYGFRCVWN